MAVCFSCRSQVPNFQILVPCDNDGYTVLKGIWTLILVRRLDLVTYIATLVCKYQSHVTSGENPMAESFNSLYIRHILDQRHPCPTFMSMTKSPL